MGTATRMMFDLKRLCDDIADMVRQQESALCATCLTGLIADQYSVDELDVRVAVVHLALGPGFTSDTTCGRCGRPEQRRNPVLQATPAVITLSPS